MLQNWCLLKNLPLILEDFIQPSSKAWLLLLLLQEVVEIICAPKFLQRQLSYLEDIMEECLKLRKKPTSKCETAAKTSLSYTLPVAHISVRTSDTYVDFELWEKTHSYFKQIIRYLLNFINFLFLFSQNIICYRLT